MLPAILRKFGLTGAGVAPPQPVAPLAIRDRKVFDRLDRLISANWGEIPQDKIPDEVMIAVEEGKPVPRRRPSMMVQSGNRNTLVTIMSCPADPDAGLSNSMLVKCIQLACAGYEIT